MVRLNGVVRSGGIAPMSSAPPASTVPLVGSQPSSTHTQQPQSVLMVRLGTCRAPMVLAVVSAVWLPVMFFQLCDRLSHWGVNFHSAPSHQRLQLTMPAGLPTLRSFECRSRKPLGRVTCTEGVQRAYRLGLCGQQGHGHARCDDQAAPVAGGQAPWGGGGGGGGGGRVAGGGVCFFWGLFLAEIEKSIAKSPARVTGLTARRPASRCRADPFSARKAWHARVTTPGRVCSGGAVSPAPGGPACGVGVGWCGSASWPCPSRRPAAPARP